MSGTPQGEGGDPWARLRASTSHAPQGEAGRFAEKREPIKSLTTLQLIRALVIVEVPRVLGEQLPRVGEAPHSDRYLAFTSKEHRVPRTDRVVVPEVVVPFIVGGRRVSKLVFGLSLLLLVVLSVALLNL